MGLCLYDIAFIIGFDKKYNEKFIVDGIVKIVSLKEETDYFYKYEARFNNNDKIIIYLDKTKTYYPGDVLKIQGEFSKPDMPSNYKEFNYRNYLKTKKIYGMIKVDNVKWINTKKDFTYFNGRIQRLFVEKIDQLYDGNSREFLKGVLLGNTNEIDEKIKNSFRKSSISHILAISGLHVSYVTTGLRKIISKKIKNKRIQNIVLILFLIVFMIVTGLTASCMRACIMNIMVLVSELVYRKNDFYRSFLISFILLIIINPFNIYNIGMWLSYFGTLRNSAF